MTRGYRVAFGQKGLMRFIHLNNALLATLMAVGTFAAIRFTLELGQTEKGFGLLASAMGIVSFVITVVAGLVVDRTGLRRMIVGAGLAAGAAMLVMGATDQFWLTAAGFLAAGPIGMAMMTPTSIWVSRGAGRCSQASAFAVHKVVTAGYTAAAMALMGVLEQIVGIRMIWLGGGIVVILLTLLHLCLPDPGSPAARSGLLRAAVDEGGCGLPADQTVPVPVAVVSQSGQREEVGSSA
jgi:MFS family permease